MLLPNRRTQTCCLTARMPLLIAATVSIVYAAFALVSNAQDAEQPADSFTLLSESDTADGKHRYGAWYTPSEAQSITGVSVGPFLSDLFHKEQAQTLNGFAVEIIGPGAITPLFLLLAPIAPELPPHPIRHPFFSSDTTGRGIFASDTTGRELSSVADSLAQDSARSNAAADGGLSSALRSTSVNGVLVSVGGTGVGHLQGIGIHGLTGGGKDLSGLSVAGLFSATTGQISGVSAAGLINIAQHARDVVLGGVWAVVTEDLVGVTGGAINHVNRGRGLMLGAWTASADLRGGQVGLVNTSARTRGVQIGLLNVTSKRTLPLLNWGF